MEPVVCCANAGISHRTVKASASTGAPRLFLMDFIMNDVMLAFSLKVERYGYFVFNSCGPEVPDCNESASGDAVFRTAHAKTLLDNTRKIMSL
jgi:hypothetical protein